MPVSIHEFLSRRHLQTVVDVRSEGEFAAGHIPGAVNIPILNNIERVIVGTAYKQQGQRVAIGEGFRLVGPRLNELVAATEKVAAGKEILVHCWRGGMRSGNFCQFMSMAGIRTQAVTGGYKQYRTLAAESFRKPLQMILLAGYTGSGKSEMLRGLASRGEQILDLESIAHHKGSAFGGLFMPPQPTTEQFQNDLFEEILKLDPARRVWIEDESLAIGRIFLPIDFWNIMKISPMVHVDVSKDIRIARLVMEYGSADPVLFLEIMGKLVKRLGGQHFNAAKERLLAGDMPSVMEILLTYYDKTYAEGAQKRIDDRKALLHWDGVTVNDIVNELMQLPLFTNG